MAKVKVASWPIPVDLNAQELLILQQALRIGSEDESIFGFATEPEVEELYQKITAARAKVKNPK